MSSAHANEDYHEGDWATMRSLVDPIRQQVFVDEQLIPASVVWDALDDDAVHCIQEHNGIAVATCRWREFGDCTAKLERMAVLRPSRRHGIGRLLLLAAFAGMRRRGLTSVVLHSQMSAAAFYRCCGFRSKGTPFNEAGIEHVTMTMDLSDATEN